jgi:hypothetical protein
LVGEDIAERRLFSSSSGVADDSICSDFDIYIRKLQVLLVLSPNIGHNTFFRNLLLSVVSDRFYGAQPESYTFL